MQLNHVPAVITGGASGLGAGAARVLAAAGAKVALLDLQMDKARALAAEQPRARPTWAASATAARPSAGGRSTEAPPTPSR